MPSSPSPSAPLNPAALRSTLKTWERHFKAIQGRVPTKADIKANPDIAKMYSAYNLSRTGARPKPSSLPAGVPSPGKGDPTQTTPKTQKRVQKLALPDQGPSKTSMTYSKADSPSKLRKLAQENSPRKVDPSRSARAQRRLMNSRANPFNSSYGGQGSPGLFADALPPPNTTPRTRARNFLIGVGSPIKAKANGRTPHGRTPSTGLLSSFLNPQRTSPAKHFQAGAARGDEGGGDGEDEVLGPSPFKPKANSSFKSLFDLPDHQADLEATPLRKQSNLKWKISSQPPFNSQAQRAFVDAPAKDNPTNFQGTKVAKDLRRASSLGSKRKRAVTAEEDERFDKDIKVEPDIAPAQNRVAHSDASKKKRVAHSKKQVPAAKPALAASRWSPYH